MIDLKKPVQTRDGRKVRVLCTDGPEPMVVAGYIEEESPPDVWTKSGACDWRDDKERDDDLINVPEKRVVWVNMLPGKGQSYSRGHAYSTRNIAEINRDNREACIRVEYEVGQFDEEPEGDSP